MSPPDLQSYLKPVHRSKADSFVPGGAPSCFLSHGDVDRTLVLRIQPDSMDLKEEAHVVGQGKHKWKLVSGRSSLWRELAQWFVFTN